MHPLLHLAPAAVLALVAGAIVHFAARDWAEDMFDSRAALATGISLAVLLAATAIALHPVIAWSLA